MNSPPKPKLALSAKYLGPVISLDCELTKNAQNLIFARNGTGKSFLSRAFRYLDLHGQGEPLSDAARNLVSDESPDGRGEFTFSRGGTVIGSLRLDKISDAATVNVTETIFHVFSEDFVHEELRVQEFNLNGRIENTIAVDSSNIKLTEAQTALTKAREDETTSRGSLSVKFEAEKLSELNTKAEVRKQLNDYKALTFERLLKNSQTKPAVPDYGFAALLKDLDGLKAIPSEPTYPGQVNDFLITDIDWSDINTNLARVTSPSSTSEAIKNKIESHYEFYKSGAEILTSEHHENCPFCEQSLKSADTRAIIDAYISYFSDEEEKHKSILRDFLQTLKRKADEVKRVETTLTQQKVDYDDLKRYVPSKRNSEVQRLDKCTGELHGALSDLIIAVENKMKALAVASSISTDALSRLASALNKGIEDNNAKAANLNDVVKKSDEERKTLQRNACSIFETEFAIKNWPEITQLKLLTELVLTKTAELDAIERASPSKDARSRVATTFKLLLRSFFADKYVFEESDFTLKRGDRPMARGAHRTLSDGEKTAIAFCYFLACVHRKVGANRDYRKLFLVFDDPVTS